MSRWRSVFERHVSDIKMYFEFGWERKMWVFFFSLMIFFYKESINRYKKGKKKVDI